ncbi:unnamed protein product, partial [Didymodactylos carnosus]
DVGTPNKAEENTLICNAFDQIKNSTRTTGSTYVHIESAKLSILGGTTGGKYQRLMNQWNTGQGLEGIHNRMNYLVLQRRLSIRPQDLNVRLKDKTIPSLAHILVVAHLFGDIEYRFDKKTNDLRSTTASTNSQIGIDDDEHSAFHYVFNKTADHADSLLTSTQDKHIQAFYAKTSEIYPRYCVLLQIYRNITEILQKSKDEINFDDGEVEQQTLRPSFINEVQKHIEQLYLKKAARNSQQLPILYVTKDTCMLAWYYYEHIFNIALLLFDMENALSTKSSLLITKKTQTPAQIILSYEFNFFTKTTLTGKNPLTNANSPFHNKEHLFDEGIRQLISAGLVMEDRWIQKSIRSYMKVIPPEDPTELMNLEEKLKEFNVSLLEYETIYRLSAKPSASKFTAMCCRHLASNIIYVKEYYKYVNDENMRETIEYLLNDGKITEEVVNGEKRYVAMIYDDDTTETNTNLSQMEKQSIFPAVYENNGPQQVQSETDGDRPVFAHLDTSKCNSAIAYTTSVISIDDNNNQELAISQLLSNIYSERDEGICNDDQQQEANEQQQEEEFMLNSNYNENENNLSHQVQPNAQEINEYQLIKKELSIDLKATTASNQLAEENDKQIKQIAQKILLSHSVFMTQTDVTKMTTHWSTNRQAAIDQLLNKRLLIKDFYFSKRNKGSSSLTSELGYAKCFPLDESITERIKFNKHLNEYGVDIKDYLQSFNGGEKIEFDTNNCPIIKNNNVNTNCKSYGLSEKAEELFYSNVFYKQYVTLDKQQILRPLPEISTNLVSNSVDTYHESNKRPIKRNKAQSRRRSKRKKQI